VPLSVDDDFFHLGGDSILAIRVASSARAAGMSFSVADVFRLRTIAALAAEVRPAQPAGPEGADGLTTVPNSPTLEQLRESGTDPDAWVYTETFSVPGQFSAETIRRAYGSLVARVEALRIAVDAHRRRLWLSHVQAEAPTVFRATEVRIPQAGTDGDETLREAARDMVEITAGKPSGLAYSQTATSTVIAVAVHAGAVDRHTLHRISQSLHASLIGVAPPHPYESIAHGFAAGEAARRALPELDLEMWLSLLARVRPIDNTALGLGTTERFRWEGARTAEDARAGILRALRSPGLYAAIGAVVDEDCSLAPGVFPAPWGSFTAAAPVDTEQADVSPSPDLPLLRYRHGSSRLLRNLVRPSTLLTHVYAQAPAYAEGPERLYPVVIRYRIDQHGTNLTVLGLQRHVVAEFASAVSRGQLSLG
ncbi:MAG: phosphopantetheine-binding protein, partial [Microbacterium sp.]